MQFAAHIAQQLSVHLVFHQHKDLGVHTVTAHPLDLCLQQIHDLARGIALTGKGHSTGTAHRDEIARELRVDKRLIVQAAVELRQAADNEIPQHIQQQLPLYIPLGQRLLPVGHTEAGLCDGHCKDGLPVGQRAALRGDRPLDLMRGAGAVKPVALAGIDRLRQRDLAGHAQHHVGGRVERLGAAVKHLRRQLGNALDRAGDVVPQRVVRIQAAEQCIQQPPVGAVIVHLDLLPDDALLLGDGGLGKPRLAHHAQQNVKVFVDLLRGGEEIAGAVIAGKGVGRGTGLPWASRTSYALENALCRRAA